MTKKKTFLRWIIENNPVYLQPRTLIIGIFLEIKEIDVLSFNNRNKKFKSGKQRTNNF
jgi:hypothetical protein